MRFTPAILAAALSLPQALAYSNPNPDSTSTSNSLQPTLYEAIHQAENTLAETLDTKNYARLGDSLTKDVVYDSRPLGPDYGGLSVGLEQITANIKAAFGDAKVAHHVSNAIIKPQEGGKAANVTT